MDEVVLWVNLGKSNDLYVSPISRKTYDEQVEDNALGGDDGYFVLHSHRSGDQRLEVLAKVPSLEAANTLLGLIKR